MQRSTGGQGIDGHPHITLIAGIGFLTWLFSQFLFDPASVTGRSRRSGLPCGGDVKPARCPRTLARNPQVQRENLKQIYDADLAQLDKAPVPSIETTAPADGHEHFYQLPRGRADPDSCSAR